MERKSPVVTIMVTPAAEIASDFQTEKEFTEVAAKVADAVGKARVPPVQTSSSSSRSGESYPSGFWAYGKPGAVRTEGSIGRSATSVHRAQ